jgi:pimeloyl-ACP methyl ester carboxylesterase
MLHANGARLCLQMFGAQGDPAILLLAGAASSMDWWEDDFCQQLAAQGRLVIRYDYRDTGRSVSYRAGSPPYGLDDSVDDSVGLLDVLGIDRAHIAGISMGGGIGQRLALDHRSRVASLSLMATSPGMRPGAPLGPGLPPPALKLWTHFARPAPEPDWTSREAVIEHIAARQQILAGAVSGGTARFRQIAPRAVDRTTDIEATLTNHWRMDPGPPY